jgi:hypothetical protein
MHLTKIINTKRITKNKTKYIGFILHQIPDYLTREHFKFNHSGYTFVEKSDIKPHTLIHFSNNKIK